MITEAPPDVVERACAETASHHGRLCPRQVLGVRMGLAGVEALGLEAPYGKRLIALAETDGCFVDGVVAATGCTVGHRTLRVVDYGRVAVTLVDADTSEAVRISPQPGVRGRAAGYAPGEPRRYYQQLQGYQRMPASELLRLEPVALTLDLRALVGERGVRVDCARCGEEVLNRREVTTDAGPLCLACASPAYYCSPSGGAARG